MPILCLSNDNNLKIFVSGGMDGHIIIWTLVSEELNQISQLVFKQLYNFDILSKASFVQEIYDKEQKTDIPSQKIENNVQSVCICMNNLCIGTRTGDIYEIPLPTEADIKEQLIKINKEKF